jgi:hypothetical protein
VTPTTLELRDMWGVDLDTPLTAVSAERLAKASIPSGGQVRFVARYVSLGPPVHGDLTLAETEAVLASGLALFAVQHCRASQGQGWETSGARGASDGHWAAQNAAGAGLPTGMGIAVALDLEDVAQTTWGQPTIDHCTEWCRQVALGGFEPVVYVGFCAGLTALQLYEIPTVRRYWADAGPRTVSTRGFCCKQHPTTTVAGLNVDPDYASSDNEGDRLLALAAGPDLTPLSIA